MSFPRYPTYKDSGVEWLGQVPEHWNVKPLWASCSCNDDVLPETTADDTSIRYIEISDVSLLEGVSSGEEMLFALAPSRARRRVQKGDVIVSTVRTYLRAIAQVEDDDPKMVVSTGFAVLRPRGVEPRYLRYVLSSEEMISSIISHSKGVSYPAINSSELTKLKAAFPSLPDQRIIAEFLDRETSKIDVLVSEQETLLKLLEEKRAATISHVVTKGLYPNVPMKDSGVEWLGQVPEHWKLTALRHTTRCLDRQRVPLNREERSERKGDIPYWGANGVVDYVDEALLDGEFVLLGEDGAPFFERGKQVAFVSTGPIWPNNHVHVLKANDGYEPSFLAYSLNLTEYAQFIDGSTRDKLTQDSMKAIPLAVPPHPEQMGIVSMLRESIGSIDTLATEARKNIALLRERRAALISAAVTGRIDVRGTAKPIARVGEAA